jgi:hypothetical protein
MTIRREADAVIRDPFNPTAPGDYGASPETVRGVLETLAGTKDKLYDLRYPGVLASYDELSRRDEVGKSIAVLCHRTLEHAIELTVRAAAVTPFAASSAFVDELLATLGRPTVQADPEDRGALEKYRLLERREDGGFTLLRLRHIIAGHDMEVGLRVESLPPQRAYAIALDKDDLWRKNGHVVYDERRPRPR